MPETYACCQHCDDDRHAAFDPPPHRKPCTTCQLEKPTVTVETLAAWFREHKIRTSPGSPGCAWHPELLAETILEDLTGKPHPMPAETPRKGPGYKCGAPECPACYPEDDTAADPELNAIRAITGLLQGLDEATRPRVLRYLGSRFDPHRDCPF